MGTEHNDDDVPLLSPVCNDNSEICVQYSLLQPLLQTNKQTKTFGWLLWKQRLHSNIEDEYDNWLQTTTTLNGILLRGKHGLLLQPMLWQFRFSSVLSDQHVTCLMSQSLLQRNSLLFIKMGVEGGVIKEQQILFITVRWDFFLWVSYHLRALTGVCEFPICCSTQHRPALVLYFCG